MDPVRNPYAPGAGRRSLIDRHSDHIGRGGGVVGVARVDSGDVVGPRVPPASARNRCLTAAVDRDNCPTQETRATRAWRR